MTGLEIERFVKISAKFKAEDWNLYLELPGIEDIADKLNSELEFYVNSGFPKYTVLAIMMDIIRQYESYGANDHHARLFLIQVIDEIYSYTKNS